MQEVKSRDILAQDIMDIYYGDFKDGNEQFYDIDFFIRKVDEAYAFILEREWKEVWRENQKNNTERIEYISLDPQWWKKVELELKRVGNKYVVTLPEKIQTFLYDKNNAGVQDVQPGKDSDCELIRSSMDRAWIRNTKKQYVPSSPHTYWWVETGSTIAFDKDCCKHVDVYYIPAASKDLDIQGSKALEIQTLVLNILRGAEAVVDTTNDSNPNKTIQSEINKEQVK